MPPATARYARAPGPTLPTFSVAPAGTASAVHDATGSPSSVASTWPPVSATSAGASNVSVGPMARISRPASPGSPGVSGGGGSGLPTSRLASANER